MAVEYSEPAVLNGIPNWKGLGHTWCSVWSGRSCMSKFVLVFVRPVIKEFRVGRWRGQRPSDA